MTNAEFDEAFVSRAIARIFRLMQVLCAGGAVAAAFAGGWRAALGFLVGAGASYLNFVWLHHTIEAIGGARRPGKFKIAVMALRYVILGAAGYVIVRFLGLNLVAVCTGLFVPVAAVIFEMLFELLYARI